MKNTICLYEYPAAVRDLKGWVEFMIGKDKLCTMTWTDPKRPSFGICHTAAPDGSRPVHEMVYCIPLNDLLPTTEQSVYTPDFTPNKVVIFGALCSSIVPSLDEFLRRYQSTLDV